ncbi:Rix1 complex component [Radiomyces spectabilis]|uniref:Rix1 complex component n=1 Tax=Radiomyces spectabilis TaxID=64574 RepID=UPI00221EFE71|nr:Rix1 complex component [Radiomyces spectabilis]KAI8384700.1 Rix1 complex component [Radiomyces spectabilis]
MPNARKKKAAKNEDFKKKRLKVGKQKALPDSFTDTSFKSKSISLPNQSITEDKSREITTSRNLTLSDLIVQLRHYNASVKKDALSGMQELCLTHPDLLLSSLSLVVNGILKLFVDEDRDVRKALLGFLRECFLPMDKIELQPFLPVLIMYTCSAMTHIFEEVRLDAIKLLDLWVEIAPNVIVTKFWERVMGNYMSLLAVESNSMNTSKSTSSLPNVNTASVASVKAAASKSHLHLHKSKLELLTSLTKFLEAGLLENQQDSFWFLLNFIDNLHARQAFQHHFDPEKKKGRPVVRWEAKSKTMFTPTNAFLESSIPYLTEQLTTFSHLNLFESVAPKTRSFGGNQASGDASKDSSKPHLVDYSLRDRIGGLKNLIHTLQPILIGTWLETAPVVFSSSSNIGLTPALQLLHADMRLTLDLWRAMISGGMIDTVTPSWLVDHLEQMLKRLMVYFPYGADSFGMRPAKVDELLLEMNIMLCELTSLYLLARGIHKSTFEQQSITLSNRKRVRQEMEFQTGADEIPAWADAIVDYIFGVLGFEEHAAPSSKKQKGSMTSMSSDFNSENLASLLPAIWGLMNCLEGSRRDSIFEVRLSIVLFLMWCFVLLTRRFSLQAFLNFFRHCHSHSASKRIALEFIIRVYLVRICVSGSMDGKK